MLAKDKICPFLCNKTHCYENIKVWKIFIKNVYKTIELRTCVNIEFIKIPSVLKFFYFKTKTWGENFLYTGSIT